MHLLNRQIRGGYHEETERIKTKKGVEQIFI